jgi:hypothetical protein
MVAVTGALSRDNVEQPDDIDYLVVTERRRVWLCRAIIIQFVVKPGARRGFDICPNYIISEDALRLSGENLFLAFELAQMIPLSGHQVYDRLRTLNDWTHCYLPNAAGSPRPDTPRAPSGTVFSRIVETTLRTPPADGLERWERERKIRRLVPQGGGAPEVTMSADWCKGHFQSHSQLVRRAFEDRLRSLAGQGALDVT